MALVPPPDPESGEKIMPWARAIGRVLRQIIPRESKDILPKIGSSGTSYELRRKPSAEPPRAVREHGFQILPDPAGTAEVPKVSVHLDSWLMGGTDATDKVTITGCGEAFEIGVDEYIYIEVSVSAGAATAAEIKHGERWANYPTNYNASGEPAVQDKAYRLIAYTQAYEDDDEAIAGNPIDFPKRLRIGYLNDDDEPASMQIVQCLDTHLIMQGECKDGLPIISPVDCSTIPAPV